MTREKYEGRPSGTERVVERHNNRNSPKPSN